jgi:hypothetical protein
MWSQWIYGAETCRDPAILVVEVVVASYEGVAVALRVPEVRREAMVAAEEQEVAVVREASVVAVAGWVAFGVISP